MKNIFFSLLVIFGVVGLTYYVIKNGEEFTQTCRSQSGISISTDNGRICIDKNVVIEFKSP